MKEKLNEWQRVCDKATPGPWKASTGAAGHTDAYPYGPITDVVQAQKNADFLSAARESMPLLIKEVERQIKQTEFMKETLERIACQGCMRSRKDCDLFLPRDRCHPCQAKAVLDECFSDEKKELNDEKRAKKV